jgi:hypothetical protein
MAICFLDPQTLNNHPWSMGSVTVDENHLIVISTIKPLIPIWLDFSILDRFDAGGDLIEPPPPECEV